MEAELTEVSAANSRELKHRISEIHARLGRAISENKAQLVAQAEADMAAVQREYSCMPEVVAARAKRGRPAKAADAAPVKRGRPAKAAAGAPPASVAARPRRPPAHRRSVAARPRLPSRSRLRSLRNLRSPGSGRSGRARRLRRLPLRLLHRASR
ncbi:hypothetical protein [Nannocystis pusilla]|uniref:hypothetical protein n=1 Tax=Nannocystis pusilla TaxID=889268 RepID=UPI003B7AB23D